MSRPFDQTFTKRDIKKRRLNPCPDVLTFADEGKKHGGAKTTVVGGSKAGVSNKKDDSTGSTKTAGLNKQEDYFSSYSDLSIHELMLRDAPRNKAYYDAIVMNKDYIRGKVCMDVGCGSGFLSMLLVKFGGAAHVHAVEGSEGIARVAEDLFKKNDMTDRITLHRKKVEDLTIEDLTTKSTIDGESTSESSTINDEAMKPISVIISEWMGFYLFHESMLDSVLYARDNFLREDGLLLPSTCTLFAAPLDCSGMRKLMRGEEIQPVTQHVVEESLDNDEIQSGIDLGNEEIQSVIVKDAQNDVDGNTQHDVDGEVQKVYLQRTQAITQLETQLLQAFQQLKDVACDEVVKDDFLRDATATVVPKLEDFCTKMQNPQEVVYRRSLHGIQNGVEKAFYHLAEQLIQSSSLKDKKAVENLTSEIEGLEDNLLNSIGKVKEMIISSQNQRILNSINHTMEVKRQIMELQQEKKKPGIAIPQTKKDDVSSTKTTQQQLVSSLDKETAFDSYRWYFREDRFYGLAGFKGYFGKTGKFHLEEQRVEDLVGTHLLKNHRHNANKYRSSCGGAYYNVLEQNPNIELCLVPENGISILSQPVDSTSTNPPSKGEVIIHFNCHDKKSCTVAQLADIKTEKNLKFVTTQDGLFGGIGFWFECGFDIIRSNNKESNKKGEHMISSSLYRKELNQVVLCTAPSSEATHWRQTLVWLQTAEGPMFAPISKGEEIQLSVHLQQSKENKRHYEIGMELC